MAESVCGCVLIIYYFTNIGKQEEGVSEKKREKKMEHCIN